MTDTANHEYGVQLRWADLDSLNHVNNVRYVDYALEAIGQLIADGLISADEHLTRIDIDYLSPLHLSLKPIRISSAVSEGRVVQELSNEGTIHARITTDIGAMTVKFAEPDDRPAHLAQLRRADLDRHGNVTPAKIFELFQEARILHFAKLLERRTAGRFVVAKLTVDFHQPIGWRLEPWPVSGRISKIGNRSLTIDSQIREDDTVFASCEATLVGFDKDTQRSRPLTDEEKAVLSPAN